MGALDVQYPVSKILQGSLNSCTGERIRVVQRHN